MVSRIMNLSDKIDITHEKFCDSLSNSFKEFYDCETIIQNLDEKEL